MGRKSREKRERREDPIWQALKAEARGRRIDSTQDAYEAVLDQRGIEGVKEGLYARHNVRWTHLSDTDGAQAREILRVLAPLAPVQALVETLGADRERLPGSPFGNWAEHIAWGVDAISASCRMLLLGQAIGAAALARAQLERWTANLAFSRDLTFSFEDLGTATMDKVWDIYELKHEPSSQWNHLCELLHGRGDLVTIAQWEMHDLLGGEPRGEILQILSALETVTRQLRTVGLALALDNEQQRSASIIEHWDLATPAELPFDVPAEALHSPLVWPLLHHHVIEEEALMLCTIPPSARLCAARKALTNGGMSKSKPSEMGALMFADHRYRAWHASARGYDAERDEIGDLFDGSVVSGRAQQMVLTTEAAALASIWCVGAGAPSLAVAATALRSAFYLWLEDDDRSMTCVRSALEAIAQARAWRLKPQRADRVRDMATTRDWLEVAGWKRLQLLNRTLGEFSHALPNSARWSDARSALEVSLMPNETGDPRKVARGGAVRLAVLLLGVEATEWLAAASPELGVAVKELLVDDQQIGELDEEAFLNKVWAERAQPFTATDFRTPE